MSEASVAAPAASCRNCRRRKCMLLTCDYRALGPDAYFFTWSDFVTCRFRAALDRLNCAPGQGKGARYSDDSTPMARPSRRRCKPHDAERGACGGARRRVAELAVGAAVRGHPAHHRAWPVAVQNVLASPLRQIRIRVGDAGAGADGRSEEHTSE